MGNAITKNGKANRPAATGRLRELETKIERGAKALWEMAEALAEIKRDNLWTETNGSWKQYCETRWGISPGWARETIAAVEVRDRLLQSGRVHDDRITVTNAKRLATVAEEDQPRVWEMANRVAAEQGAPTVRDDLHVRPAVQEYKAQKKAPPREPSAAEHAHEAAHAMQRSADAFAIDVERLIPHLDHLAEDEAQGCAYKIVETVHAVISTLQEHGHLKRGVADAILVDSTVA